MLVNLIPPKVLFLLLRCSRDQLVVARAISERTRSLLQPSYASHKEHLEKSIVRNRTLPAPESSGPGDSLVGVEVSQKRLLKVSQIGSRKKFLHSPNTRRNSSSHRGSHT